jgi:hypothetical protein
MRLRAIGAVVAAAVVLGGVLTGSGAALSADPVPGETPPSVVEDYAYPFAAQILAEHDVKLISGDGGILFANCADEPPITSPIRFMHVWTSELAAEKLCFKVMRPSGHIELEVPGVYEIRGDGNGQGNGHKATAIVRTDDGVLPPVTINPSGSTQVGQGAGGDNDPTTLLQLVVNP